MNKKSISESNRASWNQALKYHQKARGNSLYEGFKKANFTTLNRSCDEVLIDKLNKIDLKGKTIGQLPCNNGRELLSLMNFGSNEAIGFDISDIAIEEANKLKNISKLNAKFERCDILEISDKYNNYFDFIYISEGSLQWFKDLDEYFNVISRLLKNNGKLLIFEMHPFAYFFENGFNIDEENFNKITPYFDKGPYNYEDGLDYVGGVKYDSKECFWFMHKISDIFNALIKNNLKIEEFEEYNLEMANNDSIEFLDKFPLSYILIATK
ncbi:class I SAM-dependent methyltransferase [Methanobrevibacter sp. DSM 116169]|uniref:class I SAM-dependent methyltransferase n=1 Tax=Methanobrevibacter sp. DSM 116169 TaxID=3242727 RepID=UPI0038FD00A3